MATTTRRLAFLGVTPRRRVLDRPVRGSVAAGGGVTRPTTSRPTKSSGTTRQAAPTGGGPAFDEVEKKWMEPGRRIGRKAKKALYREYTDATFTTLKPRPAEWEHLGFLGPLIRAEVGDTIRSCSRTTRGSGERPSARRLLQQGLRGRASTTTARTGADKADDGVPTGGTHTYTWPVPERAGPTEHEGSSAFWMYHSHVDEIRDVASGLLGPMIITRRGMARPDGAPTDVDRELVAGFVEVDENHSWYLEDNIKTYTRRKPEEGWRKDRAPAPFARSQPIAAPGFRHVLQGDDQRLLVRPHAEADDEDR